jgi:hypothetical protein
MPPGGAKPLTSPALAGAQDQGNDGERSVRLDVHRVSEVLERVAHPLFRREHLWPGQMPP